jgi:hypothetical protein
MRFPTKLVIALSAAAIVGYAELVLDIRTPHSGFLLNVDRKQ